MFVFLLLALSYLLPCSLSAEPNNLVSLAELEKMSTVTRPLRSETSVLAGGDAKYQELISDDNTRLQHCYADDQQFDEISKDIITPWKISWKLRDSHSFGKLLLKNVTGSFWKDSYRVKRKIDSIEETEYELNEEKISKKKISSFLKDYFERFEKIESVELETFRVFSPTKWRSADLDMTRAELQIRYDLRGIEKNGARRNDRGLIKTNVVNINNKWKLENIEFLKSESLKSSHPSFEEVTQSSELADIKNYTRLEAIRRGGYALVVEDINNDSFPDIFVGAYGESYLYLGGKNGAFKKVNNSELSNEKLVKTAVFADFNNDNLKDLLLVKFVPSQSFMGSSDIVIYKNTGKGGFKKMPALEKKVSTDFAMPAAVADFNRDGLLDFYVGFPGNKDFTSFADVSVKKNTAVHGLFINKGDFKFAMQANKSLNINDFSVYSHYQKLFPHSAMAVDFDHDNDMDIIVVDDRGNLSPAFQNNGSGEFFQQASTIGIENYGYGMGTAQGDIDNDGLLDLLLTNVNFVAQDRFNQSCMSNWYQSEARMLGRSIHLYSSVSKGKFNEITSSAGLNWSGSGLAGAEFIDYNNDGFLDVYVTNGLWSGTDEYFNIDSTFNRLVGKRAEVSLALGEANSATRSNIMQVLSNTQKKSTLKRKTSSPSLAGFQRNRLFRNNQNGTFTEVGYLENVDSIADGYIISKADIDLDGDLDIILRNGDPGTNAVNYSPVQIFKNNTPNKNRSVRIRLLAEKGRSPVIGSWVKAWIGKDKVLTRHLIANNGSAQSEGILHFGIGKDKNVRKIEIYWPSGNVDTYKNLEPGLHYFKESIKSTIVKKVD